MVLGVYGWVLEMYHTEVMAIRLVVVMNVYVEWEGEIIMTYWVAMMDWVMECVMGGAVVLTSVVLMGM